MKKIKVMPSKFKIVVVVTVILLISAISVSAVAKENWMKKVELEYSNSVEQQLGEDVKAYLTSYISDIGENNSNAIANAAIQNYNTILESGVEQITDEHTAALQMSINNIIKANINEEQTVGLTESDYELLSTGVCQIVYDTLLSQIESSDMGESEEYSEEYTVLMDSLQSQIDSIIEKGQAVSITANIKNNSAEVTEDYNKALTNQKQGIMNDLSDEIQDAKKELSNAVSSEIAAKTKNLTTGKDGKDGKDGKSITGKDGNDGNSIFLVYSAYENGMNGDTVSITKTPSSEMKYMGTCTASKDPGTTDATKYTWTQYKDSEMVITPITADGDKSAGVRITMK